MAYRKGLGLISGDYAENLRRQQIWNKGTPIFGFDPAVWRRDDFGRAIRFSDYGDRESEFGWEEDHTVPVAFGGSSLLSNMRPLHWRNNASLGGLVGGLLGRKPS